MGASFRKMAPFCSARDSWTGQLLRALRTGCSFVRAYHRVVDVFLFERAFQTFVAIRYNAAMWFNWCEVVQAEKSGSRMCFVERGGPENQLALHLCLVLHFLHVPLIRLPAHGCHRHDLKQRPFRLLCSHSSPQVGKNRCFVQRVPSVSFATTCHLKSLCAAVCYVYVELMVHFYRRF